MRANPVLILVAIPLLAVTAAMLVAATLVFATICILFLVIGGRRSMHRGPWVYARHYSWAQHRPYRVPGPRRGPGPATGSKRAALRSGPPRVTRRITPSISYGRPPTVSR